MATETFHARCKRKLLEAFGSKCVICGYDKCRKALNFHHINEQEKLFAISSWEVKNWSKIVDEVKKCVLVCANCHAEIHDNLAKCPEKNPNIDFEKLKAKKYKNKPAIQTPCIHCEKLKTARTDFCSTECFIKHKSHMEFSKETFIKEFEQNGIQYIIKKYGVSNVSVYKYLQETKTHQA